MKKLINLAWNQMYPTEKIALVIFHKPELVRIGIPKGPRRTPKIGLMIPAKSFQLLFLVPRSVHWSRLSQTLWDPEPFNTSKICYRDPNEGQESFVIFTFKQQPLVNNKSIYMHELWNLGLRMEHFEKPCTRLLFRINRSVLRVNISMSSNRQTS